MTFRPDVTVAAVVQRENRFLIVEEVVKGLKVLNQPAGHLEENESLVEAVIRETLEETAWRFVPEAISGIYLWRTPDTGATFLRFAFSGHCDKHFPDRALDEGICGTLWLTLDEIRQQSDRLRSPMVTKSIDDVLAGRRYPVDVLNHLGSPPFDDLSLSAG